MAQPSLEIIRLLLEGRASLAMPFRLAVEDFRPGMQNAILDSEGGSSSVLDLAVQANSAPIVELLLSYGADRAQVSLPIEDEAVAIALATFGMNYRQYARPVGSSLTLTTTYMHYDFCQSSNGRFRCTDLRRKR